MLPVAAVAETGDEGATPEDIRYELLKADGENYRFDKKTGEILKIIKTKDGFVGVPQQLIITSRPPVRPASDPATAPGQVKPGSNNEVMPQFDETQRKKKALGPIEIFDEQGNDITYQVTDADREAASATIIAYQGSISFAQAFKVGDRITGSVLLGNTGDKKLKVLELTLEVPVVGREKPEEHRFLYVDRPGAVAPPQPAGAGKDANKLLQRIDVPCPAGGVKGSPILKVSYIKFAD